MLCKSVTVLVECHSSVLMLKGMKKKRIAVRGHSDAQLRRVSRLPSANRRRRRRRRNHKRHLVKISALAICNERNHRGLAKDKRTRFGRMRTVLPPLTQIDKSRNSQKEMLYCTALYHQCHTVIALTPNPFESDCRYSSWGQLLLPLRTHAPRYCSRSKGVLGGE